MEGREELASFEGDQMTEIVKILGVMPNNVDAVVYRRLCEIYPEGRITIIGFFGREVEHFECMLPKEDPRLFEVLAVLEKAGLVSTVGESRRAVSRKLSLQLDREYDVAEYESASLLELQPRQRIEGLWRTSAGLLLLNSSHVKGDIDIAYTDGFGRVVSDRLLRRLEGLGLKHVVFKPTVLQNPPALVNGEVVRLEVPWPDGRPAFWEITSDFTVPPFSPPYPVVDNDGRPFAGDCSNGCFPRDGLFQRAELHYAASALAPLEPFDLALTHEGFGPKPDQFDRVLVASKRFYKLCVSEGLPMDWIPVQIHDEPPAPRQYEFFRRDPADEPQPTEPLTSEEPEMKPVHNGPEKGS
jgi:hypothetical protein